MNEDDVRVSGDMADLVDVELPNPKPLNVRKVLAGIAPRRVPRVDCACGRMYLDPGETVCIFCQREAETEARLATPLTRDEALAILRHRTADQEGDHIAADEALLRLIGDPEITEAFFARPKWYA